MIGFRPGEINQMVGLVHHIVTFEIPDRNIVSSHTIEERVLKRHEWIKSMSPTKRRRMISQAFLLCGWTFWSNKRGRKNKIFVRPL